MAKKMRPHVDDKGRAYIGPEHELSSGSGGRQVYLTDDLTGRERFVFWFGAYGVTRVLATGRSIEEALGNAVDYLADKMPGYLADDAVREGYEEAIAEGLDEEQAQEQAEQDTTLCAGGHYLNAWEWGICLENPSRADLLAFVNGD
jgi:hypothetical protein